MGRDVWVIGHKDIGYAVVVADGAGYAWARWEDGYELAGELLADDFDNWQSAFNYAETIARERRMRVFSSIRGDSYA